jgi:hypothetical protein
MRSEREYLVSYVFRKLRAWCFERKLLLEDVDLRWGVPRCPEGVTETEVARESILGCMNALEECRELNDMPYIVGILGDKAGWTPTENEFPDDLRKQ